MCMIDKLSDNLLIQKPLHFFIFYCSIQAHSLTTLLHLDMSLHLHYSSLLTSNSFKYIYILKIIDLRKASKLFRFC